MSSTPNPPEQPDGPETPDTPERPDAPDRREVPAGQDKPEQPDTPSRPDASRVSKDADDTHDVRDTHSRRDTHAVREARGDGRRPHQGLKLLGVAVLVPIVIGIVLALFAWPVSQLAPRDLPIGVAGPAQVTDPLAQQLAGAGKNAFDVHRYPDEAAARAAIQDREVYGAVVAGRDGIALLVASAASPLVAQLLTQAVAGQAQATGLQPQIADVVPAPTADPRGVVFGATLLPLVLAGLAIGILMALVSRPGLAQLLGLLVASVLTGLVTIAIAQTWLEALRCNWWVNAGVVSLTVLAIAVIVAGLGDLIGPVGLGLGVVLVLFVGNPFAGVTTAPELLPRWAGVTGQLLPPGAGGTLLRSTAFFDGAAALRPVAVLCAWVAIGLAFVLLGTLLRRPGTNTH